MDEVITCHCGSQEWIIGTNGTRCAKCGHWLDANDIKVDVCLVNSKLKQRFKKAFAVQQERDRGWIEK